MSLNHKMLVLAIAIVATATTTRASPTRVAAKADDRFALLKYLEVERARGPEADIGKVAELGGQADRTLALAAARTTRAIAEQLQLSAGDLAYDVEAIVSAREQWHRVSKTVGHWSDIRVEALTLVRDLGELLTTLGHRPSLDAGLDFDELLADPDPIVKRAAIELLPHSADTRARLQKLLRSVEDPTLALVAGQVLCEAPHPQASEVISKLRRVVAAPSAELIPAIGAAQCLLAAGDARSLQAVEKLKRRLPKRLRGQLETPKK